MEENTNAAQNYSAQQGIGRIPPQSIEAEKALLGSIMLDKEGIVKVIDFLTPEDFYKSAHGIIYEAMTELFKNNEPIDALSLPQKLKEKNKLEEVGGASYIAELSSTVPTPSHLLYYAKVTKEKKNLRDLIQVSDEINSLAYDENQEVKVVLDEAERKVFSIAQHSSSSNFMPVSSVLDEAFERIDRIHSQKDSIRGITTGFGGLDHLLAGFQKGDLILLAARPSLGKSAMALNIAQAATKQENLPIGIFSLEMSKEQMIDRLISMEAGLSLWKLRTGKLSDKGEENDFSKLQEALSNLSQLPIYIEDTGSISVLQMRAMARRLQSQKGLGLIVIDYLQLIQPSAKAQSPVQEITEISRDLKALAKELEVPVLALSQLSRAVEHRQGQPRLSDLRESGSLEQDSDVVMFIHREDKIKPDTPRQNIADIIIAKHRNGPVGEIELYFDSELTSFREIDRSYE